MLADKLKQLRKEKGLSQYKIAGLLNMSRSAYSSYETNQRSPNYEILTQIAELYDVSIDYLLDRREYPRLTDDEVTLIDGYRSLPPPGRDTVQDFLAFKIQRK